MQNIQDFPSLSNLVHPQVQDQISKIDCNELNTVTTQWEIINRDVFDLFNNKTSLIKSLKLNYRKIELLEEACFAQLFNSKEQNKLEKIKKQYSLLLEKALKYGLGVASVEDFLTINKLEKLSPMHPSAFQRLCVKTYEKVLKNNEWCGERRKKLRAEMDQGMLNYSLEMQEKSIKLTSLKAAVVNNTIRKK